MIILIGLAVIGVTLLPFLSAQEGEEPGRSEVFNHIKHLAFLEGANLCDGRHLLELKDKIGLTREQEEKIENLVMLHEAFSIRNSAEIKVKELRFAAYLKSGKMNRNEIGSHIREISKEKTDLIIHGVNYLLDVRSLLTPHQLETLAQMKKKQSREGK